MVSSRPDPNTLIGKSHDEVPASLQRIMGASAIVPPIWIGPAEGKKLSREQQTAFDAAHGIMMHLCIQAPTAHASGHPGGPLSSFTFAYLLGLRRDPAIDQPLRYSAGHLSLLAYGLQWMFGREGSDPRLASPMAIIENFRTPNGLAGHVEAGIGDIPFGTGPLGKGVSHGLGTALGLAMQKKKCAVDVLLADGDAQEGQVMEAFRLAAHLKLDNLIVHGDFNDIQLSDMPSKTVAADFAAIAIATGWQVIEVQNGNDPAQVQAALDQADAMRGKGHPIFICYYTTMGHGVKLMEEGSNTGKANYHGSPLKDADAKACLALLPSLEKCVEAYAPFQKQQKKRYTAKPATATDIALPWHVKKGYARTIVKEKGAARRDFGAVHLKNLMVIDPRIVVLHADLAASGGFDTVAKEFPDRVLNVGVAEANMAMMAAGLRQAGMLPVTYTFASFGTNEARANARLIDVNCSHTRCGVIHDCTHAGVSVGEDGETHQEQNYLNIPFRHTQVWMPADSNQAGAMAERAMEIIAEGHESVFVFSPRTGHGQLTTPKGDLLYGPEYTFTGNAELIRGTGTTDDTVTILASGICVHAAVAAADELAKEGNAKPIRVLNIASVRPLDATAVLAAAFETGRLIVVEDHNVEGGLATQIADVIADFQIPCTLRRMGLTQYFPSAKAEDLMFMAGLDTESIVETVRDVLSLEIGGGEEIFVTAIFNITQHLAQSRFREKALPFVEDLLERNGYLEALRSTWKSRTVESKKLPNNARLKALLGNVPNTLR